MELIDDLLLFQIDDDDRELDDLVARLVALVVNHEQQIECPIALAAD